MLSKLLVLLLGLLAVPACAGTGGPQQPTATHKGGKRTFVGQTFSDTTTLAALAKAGDVLLEFERCTFAGLARFTNAAPEFGTMPMGIVFKDCTFENDLMADQTLFAGRLNMVKCRFKKRAQFNNCTFMAPAGWRTCAFDGDATWNNSLFWREASYMDCNFSDVARLQACRFMATAQFSNGVYHKNADFTLCKFDDGAWFDFAHFMAAADFGSARTGGPLSFRTTQVAKLMLNNLQAGGIVNMAGLQTTDSVRVQGATFAKGKPALGPK